MIAANRREVNIWPNSRALLELGAHPKSISKLFLGHGAVNFFSSKRYLFESLALRNDKGEKIRAWGSSNSAFNTFSQVSLRIHGGCQAYTEAIYATLDEMMIEH